MLKEATSYLKNNIKDADLQERALKLLNSAFSYVELDEKKQANIKKLKEAEKAKELKAKSFQQPVKED